jgi:glycosyltransferase involved in cell wall biosynthesis
LFTTNKKEKTIKILIICDTARIGGVERLALDQAYELSSMYSETNATILILNSPPTDLDSSFIKNEEVLIKKLGIDIIYAPGKRLTQLQFLKKYLATNEFKYIFTSSMRASVMSWCLRFAFRFDFIIFNTVQQLPSLTSPNQHLRRSIYSQFSDKLFICCASALDDWNNRRKKSLLIKLVSSRRKVELCRNGVYLPRLISNESLLPYSGLKRFVFIGRLTAWKGLETFLRIAQQNEFEDVEILLVTPTNPSNYLVQLDKSLLSKIQCVVGKSISEIEFKSGDLHLYPATYGDNTFVEGISLNVLEMACIGIPSLVTKNGCATWPELQYLGLVYEVDWNDISGIKNVISKINIQAPSMFKARAIIDIRNQLNQMLSQ